MMFIGYKPGTKDYRFWSKIRRTVVISSTAAFDEFDFPNCPREKLQDKPPPPKIQSPGMSDSGNMDHDHNDPGGDDNLQPPDHDQPDVDTKEDNEDPYELHICIPARHSPPWMPPRPPNPQGSTSTGEA